MKRLSVSEALFNVVIFRKLIKPDFECALENMAVRKMTDIMQQRSYSYRTNCRIQISVQMPVKILTAYVIRKSDYGIRLRKPTI